MSLTEILFIILYILAIPSLIYGLWMMIPFFYGLPWVPTEKDRIRKALQMANLQPNELLYDLGSGDGRILFIASEEFGARAIGIEASFLQYLFTKLKIYFSGSKPKVSVRRENFYRTDFSDADVIFAFMTSSQVVPLDYDLVRQLKPGARVVTVSFDFPDWKPNNFDEDYLLFSYVMPPKKGGLIAYLSEN